MLIERIDAEMKDAARAKDAKRLTVLRALKSALKYREIEKSKASTDEDVVAVCATLIKQRRDSVAQYTDGGRPELAAAESAEIVILETFLPKQLTALELEELVKQAIAATGAKSPKEMGAVMKALKPQVAGKAEGEKVSAAVKAALAALAG